MEKSSCYEVVKSLGVTTSSFKILCHLAFSQGSQKPGEISQKLDMKPGTVRARLSELKETGLVSSEGEGYVSNITPYDIIIRIYEEIKYELKEAKGRE